MRRLLLVLVAVSVALAAYAPAAQPAQTAATAVLPLTGRVIALDPGHQLGNARYPQQINRRVWVGLWKACNTTGTATNGGFPEATFAWKTTLRLKEMLESRGATVRLTRTTNSLDDWGPCIDARGRFGARVGADLMVSIHGDGAVSTTRGFFVIRPGWREGYTDDIARPSRQLALDVRGGLRGQGFAVSSSYGGDGLDTRRDLGTLNTSDVPAVVVELGNMRNGGDAACMASARCRGRYARGLLAGIVAHFARTG